jgi:hypothetical protein
MKERRAVENEETRRSKGLQIWVEIRILEFSSVTLACLAAGCLSSPQHECPAGSDGGPSLPRKTCRWQATASHGNAGHKRCFVRRVITIFRRDVTVGRAGTLLLQHFPPDFSFFFQNANAHVDAVVCAANCEGPSLQHEPRTQHSPLRHGNPGVPMIPPQNLLNRVREGSGGEWR